MIRRVTAYTLMLIGFIWIVWACVNSAHPYSLWVWHSQHLTTGETIPRADAVSQMKDLQIAVRDLYRPLVVPALLMLVGGILNGIGRRSQNQQVHRTQ